MTARSVEESDARVKAWLTRETTESVPEPLVTSRASWPTDVAVPAAVSKLGAMAGGRGWEVRLTYSHGTATKYRRAWQWEELVAIRVRRGTRRAFGVYRTIAGRDSWSWRTFWTFGQGHELRQLRLLAEFVAYLTEAE